MRKDNNKELKGELKMARRKKLDGEIAIEVKDITDDVTCVAEKSPYYEKPNYNGFSFVEALQILKEDFSYAHRIDIAKANGMDNYLSLGNQNKELLEKLKSGMLLKA